MEEALRICDDLRFEWAQLYQERCEQEAAIHPINCWLDSGGWELLREASRANQELHAQRADHRKKTWKKVGNVAVKAAACVCAAGVVLLVPAGTAFVWSLVFGAVANMDQVTQLWPSPNDPDEQNLKRIYDQIEKTSMIRVLD